MLASPALNGLQGKRAPRSAIEAADLVADNILTTKTKERLQGRSGEGREWRWRSEVAIAVQW